MTTEDDTPPDNDVAHLGDRDRERDRDRAPRPRGLACPKCHLRLLVITTRLAAPGLKVRFLACRSCRVRVRSEERVTAVFDPEPAEPAE